jgi:uncharacterized Zn finger protein
MTVPGITEATIRRHASADSLKQGQEYYRSGAVLSLVRRGNVLEASVEGSEPEPYRVRCMFDAAGITDATCTCRYAYSGWCKHIVAALLAVAHGDAVEERPALETLLADLDRTQLQDLLLRLAVRDPELQRTIEGEIRIQQGLPAATAESRPAERHVQLDLNAVRRQMNAALHSPPYVSDRGWHSFRLGSEASTLLEQAWSFIRAGEGRPALDILNAMTDECLEDWQAIMEDEEGETLAFVEEELGPAWTEAILSADLTPSERDGWVSKLDAWVSELEDYSYNGGFDPALQALAEGWDDPELQRILRGEITEPVSEEGGEEIENIYGLPTWVPVKTRLAIARLNVLERQERYDEYLNLARAEGQVARYTTMLVRLGRTAEATDYGLAHLRRTGDALQLAETLREAGELERALRIAERGISLEGQKAPLATWLADLGRQWRGTGWRFTPPPWPSRRSRVLPRICASRSWPGRSGPSAASIGGLLEQHRRKYKLVPLLQALR